MKYPLKYVRCKVPLSQFLDQNIFIYCRKVPKAHNMVDEWIGQNSEQLLQIFTAWAMKVRMQKLLQKNFLVMIVGSGENNDDRHEIYDV